MTAHILPDKAVLATFVAVVFRHADPDTYAILKGFDDADRNMFPADGIKVSSPSLVDFAFNRARQTASCGRAAVFCPPVATFRDSFTATGRWSARTEDLANGLTLSVDADKRPATARETLTGILGIPTITAASGGLWTDPQTGEIEDKLHLHWRLRVPTRDAENHMLLHEARWTCLHDRRRRPIACADRPPSALARIGPHQGPAAARQHRRSYRERDRSRRSFDDPSCRLERTGIPRTRHSAAPVIDPHRRS